MDTINQYQTLLKQMLTLELITAEEYHQLKNQEAEFKEELESFPDYPVVIPAILSKVSKGIMRDAECGMIPPDYERMVLEVFKLIEKDTGRPAVELDYEKIEEGDDLYTLFLKFENDEFKKELRDCGDYYDVEGLMKMVNEVLDFKKVNYRFISLESNDQGFWWVKSQREKVVELFGLYGMEYFVDN